MKKEDRKLPKAKYHKVIRSIINDNPEYLMNMFYEQIAEGRQTSDYNRKDALEAMYTADAWIQHNRSSEKGFTIIENLQNKESFIAGYMCRREIENIKEFSALYEPQLEA